MESGAAAVAAPDDEDDDDDDDDNADAEQSSAQPNGSKLSDWTPFKETPFQIQRLLL